MTIPLYIVDAFTEEAFAGNPAAICLLPEAMDEIWMQKVAHEMNLSETAFVLRVENGFSLRWFTPITEVDLCGHATLATAHVLWTAGVMGRDEQACFLTRSGELCADLMDDGRIELDFPAEPVETVDPADVPTGLLEALRIPMAHYVGKNRFDYLVEVPGEGQVRSAQPDFRALAQITMRGVIVTAKTNGSSNDFISRFFAPGEGIDEDPVTGSAHCALGPYWGKKLAKLELSGFQASRRGGSVAIRLDKDRVKLSGRAVTVLRGELLPEAVRAPSGPSVRVHAAK